VSDPDDVFCRYQDLFNRLAEMVVQTAIRCQPKADRPLGMALSLQHEEIRLLQDRRGHLFLAYALFFRNDLLLAYPGGAFLVTEGLVKCDFIVEADIQPV
jgi:hypothetical protein